MDRNIAVLYNPLAGKGKSLRLLRSVQDKLSCLNIRFEVFEKNWPPQLQQFTDAWIVGGDGTMNFFINHYPNISIPLFLFKGGSGNDLAWKLYADKNFEDCLEMALHAAPRKVDAGICNGKYFLNGVGIGFDGEIVKSMGKKKFLSAGHLTYFMAVLRKIFFFREQTLKVKSEKLNWNNQAFMVTVANGSRFGGGFLVAPQAELNDGLLEIVIIPKIRVLKRLLYLPKVEKGKHLHIAVTAKSDQVMIEAEFPIAAHLDGEFTESAKFAIELIAGKYLFRF